MHAWYVGITGSRVLQGQQKQNCIDQAECVCTERICNKLPTPCMYTTLPYARIGLMQDTWAEPALPFWGDLP